MLTLLNLISGVAMLSWGIYMTKSGVLRTFGDKINNFLGKSLQSSFWTVRALLSGIGITALVQSSNATAMLVSSFLAKGLIALTPALVIMLGANVGSAIMTRILTFDLSFASPILLSVGIFLFLKKRQSKAGKAGRILIGLGIILLSLNIIVTTTKPIAMSQTMSLILTSLNGEFTLAFIFGALLAIICYSSLAAVILTASLVAAGSLNLQSAFVLVLGANIGSCILEIVGSLSGGIAARRVMLGNFLFKLSVVIIYIFVIFGIDKTQEFALEPSQIVIWFHVIFNITVLCTMLPLTSLYAKLLCVLIADVKEHVVDESTAKYLDTNVLANAELARINSIKEILRLGGFLHEMLNLFEQSLTGKTGHSSLIERKAHVIELLSDRVKKYLNSIDDSNYEHDGKWYQTVGSLLACIQGSDLIKRMQSDVSFLNHSKDVNFTAYTRSDLIKLCKKVNENLSVSLNALMTGDDNFLNALYKNKEEFKTLTDKYSLKQINVNQDDDFDGIDITAVVLGIITDLRQLNGIFCGIGNNHKHLIVKQFESNEEL